jgi:uncharacterized protein (TIGR03083 family)
MDTTATPSASAFVPVDEIATATHVLLAALDAAPETRVPACPDWNISQLAGHLAWIQRWVTAIVSGRLTARPAADSIPTAPTSPAELHTWAAKGLNELLASLAGAGTGSPAWNFVGAQPTSAFWHRRMVHEAWIHAIDAADASGLEHTIPAPVAVDSVDEFLSLLPPRKLRSMPDASIGGTLHLHATDAHGEWMIGLDGGILTVGHGHGKGDAALRGTAHDLALFVWGRRDGLTGPEFERFGDHDVIAKWQTIGAF